MQLMHNAMRELQVWNQLLVLPEHNPAAYLGTFHAFLWHPDPPLYQITQQGCRLTGLEPRIKYIFYFS
jgi:hypothetical protein